LKNVFVKEVGINDVQVEVDFAVERFDKNKLGFEVGGDDDSVYLLAGDEIFKASKMVLEAMVSETFNNVIAELGIAGEIGGNGNGSGTGTDKDDFGRRLAINKKIKGLAPDDFQYKNGDEKEKEIGAGSNAENGSEIEKSDRGESARAESAGQGFKKVKIIFQNFWFVESGNIEDKQPDGEKNGERSEVQGKGVGDVSWVAEINDEPKSAKKEGDIAYEQEVLLETEGHKIGSTRPNGCSSGRVKYKVLSMKK